MSELVVQDKKQNKRKNFQGRYKAPFSERKLNDALRILNKVSDYKKEHKLDPSFDEVQRGLQSGDQDIEKLVSYVESNSRNRSPATLLAVLGAKVAMQTDSSFYNMSKDKKIQFLQEYIADDLGLMLGQGIKHAAPHVLNYLWDKAKTFTPIQKTLKFLRDRLGIDTNDDGSNASTYQQLGNQDVLYGHGDEYSMDFCKPSLVAKVLCNKYQIDSQVLPSQSGTKAVSYSKVQSYTFSTNANGEAIVQFFPQRLFGDGVSLSTSFVNVMNNSTLDINTGIQTPVASFNTGPLYNQLANTIQYRLICAQVELQVIASTLNNQGRVVSIMGNSLLPTPVGLSNVRDREYLIYTSMVNASGHCMLHVNNDLLPGEFSNAATSAGSHDYIEFVITGAIANIQPLQFNVYYTVEIIPNSAYATIETPALSPAFSQVMSAVLSDPRNRVLGRQETLELYQNLIMCPSDYSSILRTVRGLKYTHRHDEMSFGRGQQDSVSSSRNVPNFSLPSIGGVTLATQ